MENGTISDGSSGEEDQRSRQRQQGDHQRRLQQDQQQDVDHRPSAPATDDVGARNLVSAQEKVADCVNSMASLLTSAGTRAVDLVVLMFVLVWEGVKFCRWVVGRKVVRVWVDLALQAFFVTVLSVLFFNVAVMSTVAGSIRKRSRAGSSRHQAMTQLQKFSFDFLHKAICCISFWVCQADIDAESENVGGGPAACNSDAAIKQETGGQSSRMTLQNKKSLNSNSKDDALAGRKIKASKKLAVVKQEGGNNSSTSAVTEDCDNSDYSATSVEDSSSRKGDACSSPDRKTKFTTRGLKFLEAKEKMLGIAGQEVMETFTKAKSIVTQQYVWDLVDTALGEIIYST